MRIKDKTIGYSAMRSILMFLVLFVAMALNAADVTVDEWSSTARPMWSLRLGLMRLNTWISRQSIFLPM